MKKLTDKKQIHFDIDGDTFRMAKSKAALQESSLSEIGRTLFRAWLDDDPHIVALLKKARVSGVGK